MSRALSKVGPGGGTIYIYTMCVCMYVSKYVCMHVGMYVDKYMCTCAHVRICSCICI